MSKEIQKVDLRQFVAITAAKKKMKMNEVAKASGRAQSTLSGLLVKGNTNLGILSEILEAMDESLVLCTSDGQKFEIEIPEK